MPRIRSASAAVAQPACGAGADEAALLSAVGGLDLQAAGGCRPFADDAGPAEAAADAFGGGRSYRAYGHNARIFDLAFHPASSSLLVSASDDCSAGVWRRQAGGSAAGGRYMQVAPVDGSLQKVAAFQGHHDSVMRVAWSPDGQLVASGSSDGVVCLWQPTEAALTARHNLGHAGVQQLGTLQGHPEEVYACIFLQNSAPSNSSSAEDTSRGSQAAPSAAAAGAAAAGPPCQRLVAASGERLFLWDLQTQKLLQEVLPPAPPPDGSAAAGASAAGAAEAASSNQAVPERWRPGYLFGVAAQPDGPLLGAACSDGRLRLWAREGGDGGIQPLCTLPWNQAMGADCVFGPNGLFCAAAKDGSVIAMDVRAGGCLQHLQLDTPLLSCTLLPAGQGPGGCGAGQCLVAAGADGGIHFVDIATGDIASFYPEAAPPRPLLCATLSADAQWLAASGEAVLVDAEDVPGAGGKATAAAGAAAAGTAAAGSSGRPQQMKWSPVHLWQRA